MFGKQLDDSLYRARYKGGAGKADRKRDGKIIISEWSGLEALRKAEDREE